MRVTPFPAAAAPLNRAACDRARGSRNATLRCERRRASPRRDTRRIPRAARAAVPPRAESPTQPQWHSPRPAERERRRAPRREWSVSADRADSPPTRRRARPRTRTAARSTLVRPLRAVPPSRYSLPLPRPPTPPRLTPAGSLRGGPPPPQLTQSDTSGPLSPYQVVSQPPPPPSVPHRRSRQTRGRDLWPPSAPRRHPA